MARKKKAAPSGSPAWMATFADMATLLMSFFVLLLAFSEMDVVKYKAVAGSMKRALGVKADSYEVTLPEGPPAEIPELRGEEKPKDSDEHGQSDEAKDKEMSPEALLVHRKLADEIEEQKIQVETLRDRIIIRLPEQGVFASGSGRLSDAFLPTLEKIRDVLGEVSGSIIVAGHTDDVPIRNGRFRSNWDLSTRRAASVVHVLVDGEGVRAQRMVAQGYADTRPLEENIDAVSRARNRRVDIILSTKKRPPPPDAGTPTEGADSEGAAEDGAPPGAEPGADAPAPSPGAGEGEGEDP